MKGKKVTVDKDKKFLSINPIANSLAIQSFKQQKEVYKLLFGDPIVMQERCLCAKLVGTGRSNDLQHNAIPLTGYKMINVL